MGYLLITFALSQPAPPKPVPVVVAAKAIITLRGGKPVPAKIEVNRTLFLSAKKSTKDPECIVKWVVFPPSLLADPENFSKFEDGTEFALNVGPTEQEILIGAAVSGGKQVDIVAVTIIVGRGPRPPPIPPVPPFPPEPPVPPVPPVPIPVPADGLRVLIVEETADRAKLPEAQLSILFDKRVRDYLNAHCPVETGFNRSAWNIWDANVGTSAVPKFWQEAMTRPRTATPWIAIYNARTSVPYFEGPLPANTTAALELLRKYGGP